ncbi:MAG: QVPTGV class sortase B protein-sorting domain-containing protein [Eubacterium sp.]|nr:QVPTGV class sortase B protein-sorting domain-containing protein [Eubacterium sp.]
MRKMKAKIGAMIASAMLAAAMMAMPVGAAEDYTPVAGDNDVTFNKYLIINQGATVPALTFEFELTAGTAIDGDPANDKMAVLAGPVVENNGTITAPTVGTAVFSDADSALTEVATCDRVTLSNGEAYAKEAVTMDFSGVTFDEPGVYRYLLTEKPITGVSAISYDIQCGDTAIAGQRTLDVYVIDKENATTHEHELEVSGYVLHTGIEAPATNSTYGSGDVTSAGTALTDKSDGFVNSLEAYDLIFSKTVSGNQASRDKYFQFTVTLSGAVAGTTYTVSYGDDSNPATVDGNADTNISANPNSATTVIGSAVTQPATLSVETGATSVSHAFYLQDGQSIVIHGIAKGTGYTVVETPEDYKPSVQVGSATATESASATGTVNASTTVAFTNTRDGIIPTGVILSVAPWVIAGIVIIGGIVFFAIRSRKKYEEE